MGLNIINQLRAQLIEANKVLDDNINKNRQYKWPKHNEPNSQLNEIYKLITRNEPENALNLLYSITNKKSAGELFYLEGLCFIKLKNFYKAIENLNKANNLDFSTPFVKYHLAIAYKSIGNKEKAIIYFQNALEQYPDFSECRYEYGMYLYQSDNYIQAETQLRISLINDPKYFQSSFELGNIQRLQNKFKLAIESYKLCLISNPKFIPALVNIGLCFEKLELLDEAVIYYQQCLTIDNDYNLARKNIINVLTKKKDFRNLITHVKYLYKQDLKGSERIGNLIAYLNALLNQNKYEEALEIANYEKNKISRLFARINVLPIIYKTSKQLSDVRERWIKDLYELDDLLNKSELYQINLDEIYTFLWSTTNFYVCYQMKNDKEIQIKYCEILKKILLINHKNYLSKEDHKKHKNDKIKIGILSFHLYNHNGSNWSPGLLEEIYKDPKYQLYSYNLSDKEDFITNKLASMSIYKKLKFEHKNHIESLNIIKNDSLDIMIFTDIGMHACSKMLSIMNLADVQINCWGHPVTSGSENIKYYLSSNLMEPDNAQDHYSEELIRLPSIGLNYPTPIRPKDGQYLYKKYGIPKSRPILSSLQSNFKYIPSNDFIFAEISKRNKNALIIFVDGMGDKLISKELVKRISIEYQKLNLKVKDHIKILPRLDHSDYMGFLSISHHTLDTINHNGGNSSLQAFSVDCPVVTLPTEFMRGRHTYSMLKEMGINELIASNKSNYIDISSNLLKDKKFYIETKDKISKNKNKLFNNLSVSKYFKKFIESKCI